MIVRAVDIDNDWLFGRGKNDYLRDLKAVEQSIKTRLQCFLGDCFFDITAGIDWFNFLGSKDQVGLELAIATTILNTENVTGILQLSAVLDTARNLTISYQVQTTFGQTDKLFQLSVPI